MADLTQEQAKALGERWMATEGFEWQPGMRDGGTGGGGVVGPVQFGTMWLLVGDEVVLRATDEGWPDLRHAGTLGFAMDQLRELLLANAETVWAGFKWRGEGLECFVDSSAFAGPIRRPVLAEAVIAAIELSHG